MPPSPLQRSLLDPGWLFLLAGLTICAAGILAPAQLKLQATRRQLARLVDQVVISTARLDAQQEFLRNLHDRDPTLIRRLAASQLNLMPAGEHPLLVASTQTARVTDWMEATLPLRSAAPPRGPETLLVRLSTGAGRLWFLATGVLCVLAGLLFGAGETAQSSVLELEPAPALIGGRRRGIGLLGRLRPAYSPLVNIIRPGPVAGARGAS